MSKKYVLYLAFPFSVIFGISLLIVCWLGWILMKLGEIGLHLGDKFEWWCNNEHKNLEQPLNPFNDTILDILKRDF